MVAQRANTTRLYLSCDTLRARPRILTTIIHLTRPRGYVRGCVVDRFDVILVLIVGGGAVVMVSLVLYSVLGGGF